MAGSFAPPFSSTSSSVPMQYELLSLRRCGEVGAIPAVRKRSAASEQFGDDLAAFEIADRAAVGREVLAGGIDAEEVVDRPRDILWSDRAVNRLPADGIGRADHLTAADP